MAPQTTQHATDQTTRSYFLALRLVSFADTLNLITRSPDGGTDLTEVSGALAAFAKIGIGRHSDSLQVDESATRLTSVLSDVLAAIEESPMPNQEWRPLTTLLGDDLVGTLVGTSTSSIQRYRHGERPTPDDIAARLHTLALIASDLAGSYNEFGIRRWFHRSRTALGGHSPADVLTGDWSPEDEPVRKVRDLARSLLGSPAT